MRKRWIAWAAALACALALAGCGRGQGEAESSLYAQGLEVVRLMAEMARTDGLAETLTGSESVQAILRDIGEGDYTAPSAVYAVSATQEDLAGVMGYFQLSTPSDELNAYFAQKMFASLPSVLNGTGGVDELAAASTYTVSKTFVDQTATENVIYLYTYDDATPVAVTFTVGEDHAVSANGMFLTAGDLSLDTLQAVQDAFPLSVEAVQLPPEA